MMAGEREGRRETSLRARTVRKRVEGRRQRRNIRGDLGVSVCVFQAFGGNGSDSP